MEADTDTDTDTYFFSGVDTDTDTNPWFFSRPISIPIPIPEKLLITDTDTSRYSDTLEIRRYGTDCKELRQFWLCNTHEVTEVGLKEYVQYVDVTNLARGQYSQIIRMDKFIVLIRNYTSSTRLALSLIVI